MGAPAQGEIKAFVYDIPSLRYWKKQQFQGKKEVLPKS